jgi:hypothetical protein
MDSADDVCRVLTSDGLLQRLAAVEHERWSHWQQYMHEKGKRLPDGSLTLPADLVRQWDEQIHTQYADLSLAEQISDQEQVQRYLPIVVDAMMKAVAGSNCQP